MASVPADETMVIDAIRVTAAALPQQANSGHPGAPIGCAPLAHALFGHVMRFSPSDPAWLARDRFVLSNGHACALQYTMLHLLGYPGLERLETLKSFRQLGSILPGHPERGMTAGVEVTTGPLGQGIAQAVGLALGAEMMAATYDRENYPLFADTTIFGIVGDGCLQEGVAAEACSLAGHLGLGRLVFFYDNNKITIDGSTELSFTEDVGARFRAMGWEFLEVPDADTNFAAVLAAAEAGKRNREKPTLISCRTTIGFKSAVAGSEKSHGAPLGVAALTGLRAALNVPNPADIWAVPPQAVDFYRKRRAACDAEAKKWTDMFQKYREAFPAQAAELQARMQPGEISAGTLPKYEPEGPPPPGAAPAKPKATRALSGEVLNAVVAAVPGVVGGSADLTGSNSVALKQKTATGGTGAFSRSNRTGAFIHFGVREHGMAAVANGLAAFGGFRPFVATFLNFVTYAWGAVRLSALSHLPVLYVSTHDSIELGEDGPTHQPVEVAALCRATPNVVYFRPADGNEVAAGYAEWLAPDNRSPIVLALCRDGVPTLRGSCAQKARRGAYTLVDFANSGKPKAVVAACGSELHLCVAAAEKVRDTLDVRVVSMTSWDLFERQSSEYRAGVIDPAVPVRLYVEAARALGAERYFNRVIDMTTFGASGKKVDVWKHFGFTVENIEERLAAKE